MRRMWPARSLAATLAVHLALAAGSASVAPPPPHLPAEVLAALERRGLGPDALLVIDNLVRHGPPPPRATPAVVLDLFARPLEALDAAATFRRSVPPSLARLGGNGSAAGSFDELLEAYLAPVSTAR